MHPTVLLEQVEDWEPRCLAGGPSLPACSGRPLSLSPLAKAKAVKSLQTNRGGSVSPRPPPDCGPRCLSAVPIHPPLRGVCGDVVGPGGSAAGRQTRGLVVGRLGAILPQPKVSRGARNGGPTPTSRRCITEKWNHRKFSVRAALQPNSRAILKSRDCLYQGFHWHHAQTARLNIPTPHPPCPPPPGTTVLEGGVTK